jgi:hypothetical protein
VKITVKFGDELPDAIARAIDRQTETRRKALEQLGQSGEDLARSLAPQLSGHFVDTITHEVDGDAVTIGSTSRRAHIIEEGRGPGRMAPPTLIAELFGVADDEAYLIARKIGDTGTSASKVFEFTRKQLESEVSATAAELAEDLGKLSSTGF